MHRLQLLARQLRGIGTAAPACQASFRDLWLFGRPSMSRETCSIHLQSELPLDKDPRQIIAGFKAAVNMTPAEVEAWLGTEESRRAVEQGGEAADKDGRHAARRVVELLHKDDELFYEGDLLHMWQISNYIRCHRAALEGQGPPGPLTIWHLRNFGFDPLKGREASGGSEPAGDADKQERMA